MFINHEYIYKILEETKNPSNEQIKEVLNRAKNREGLDYKDIAILLQAEDEKDLKEIYSLAGEIKKDIYGKRVVVFAPLYVSDYCVNNCVYCGYKRDNKFNRRRLTMDEVAQEVKILEQMGHKRLALELGEDPVNAPIDYVLECLDTIYKTQNNNGEIRRVNVNIAACSVEDYKKLHEAGIGTYTLFQETYNKENYEALHPTGPKSDYAYHTEAMDRAMQGGIDDVGIGVLYGLEHYKYDFVGLLMHAEHLEAVFGVGPHTISVPRICPADDIDVDDFSNAVPDDIFEKIVALIRVSTPYTGMIMSTRESQSMRERGLALGISQISGGSRTSVGGYKEEEKPEDNSAQFDRSDTRTLDEIVDWLLDLGYVPSFCTACYRAGRTGDRFMALAKSGQIHNCCQPNALMTLNEYIMDYGDEKTKAHGAKVIEQQLENIKNDLVKDKAKAYIAQMKDGERDFRF